MVKKVNPKKLADPLKYRAQQLRSYWLTRSKKIAKAGEQPKTVPTRQEIEDWLRAQFTGNKGVTTMFKGEVVKPLDSWQVDHKVAIENGGSFNLSNCTILTKQENQEKGSLDATQYAALLELVTSWPPTVCKKFLGRLRMSNYRFTSR